MAHIRTRRRGPIIWAIVTLAFAACGDSSSSDDAPADGTSTTSETTGTSTSADSSAGETQASETSADTEAEIVGFSGPLRVMTFNLLCSLCDPSFDPWDDRVPGIGDTIVRHDPDLIGLQEFIEESEVDQVLAVAPGYAAIMFDQGERSAYPDSTIFYRESLFEPVDHGFYWLSPTPDVPRSTGFADGFQFARLVSWAVFRRLDDDTQLYFATTHFDNNAPSQELSAPLVLERMSPFAETLPVVMVGDFNSRPGSTAYGILTGEGGFTDAFVIAEDWTIDTNVKPTPPYDPTDLIDHVFMTGGVWTTTAWTVDLWSYGENMLPLSDHWAITADLVAG